MPLHAKANPAAAAAEATGGAYDRQLTVMTQTLKGDLQAIQDNHTTQLTHAREQAALKLATIKNDICTKREQCQADLEHDCLFGKAMKCKNTCPTPISMPPIRWSRTASCVSSCTPSLSYSDRESLATEVVYLKELITLPVDVDMNIPGSNSL